MTFLDAVEDEKNPATAANESTAAADESTAPANASDSASATAATRAPPVLSKRDQLNWLRSALQPVPCGRDRQHNRYWLLPALACLDSSPMQEYVDGLKRAMAAKTRARAQLKTEISEVKVVATEVTSVAANATVVSGKVKAVVEGEPVASTVRANNTSEPKLSNVVMLFVENSRTGGWVCYESAHVSERVHSPMAAVIRHVERVRVL